MRKIILTLFCLLSFQTNAFGLKTFETDLCTMFVEGPTDSPNLWADCCIIHDLKYWYGGEEKRQEIADKKLYECVLKKKDEFWAKLIYNGVRLGHMSPIKHKYQWGWGWVSRTQKSPLTDPEIKYIREELLKLNQNPDLIKATIQESFE